MIPLVLAGHSAPGSRDMTAKVETLCSTIIVKLCDEAVNNMQRGELLLSLKSLRESNYKAELLLVSESIAP